MNLKIASLHCSFKTGSNSKNVTGVLSPSIRKVINGFCQVLYSDINRDFKHISDSITLKIPLTAMTRRCIAAGWDSVGTRNRSLSSQLSRGSGTKTIKKLDETHGTKAGEVTWTACFLFPVLSIVLRSAALGIMEGGSCNERAVASLTFKPI